MLIHRPHLQLKETHWQVFKLKMATLEEDLQFRVSVEVVVARKQRPQTGSADAYLSCGPGRHKARVPSLPSSHGSDIDDLLVLYITNNVL